MIVLIVMMYVIDVVVWMVGVYLVGFDVVILCVIIDSCVVQFGDLFVVLIGECFDVYDFLFEVVVCGVFVVLVLCVLVVMLDVIKVVVLIVIDMCVGLG